LKAAALQAVAASSEKSFDRALRPDLREAVGMAEVTREIAAAPERVFEVLADGWQYTGWVVGASHIRAVEPSWPQVGSRIHHSFGAWPLMVRDETVVEECEPASRLVLLARGRPLGEARVVLELSPTGTGTMVRMAEEPVSGPGKALHNRLLDAMLRARNVESLARLAALAEEPAVPKQ
jgi:uncharacterized protein YndB with AHSA1/START domain